MYLNSPEISALQDAVRRAAGPAAEFSFAFQPIVDTVARRVIAYEALMRGPANEPALTVFERVPADQLFRFDQDGRAAAIALAVRVGFECDLNLNFLPQGLFASPASMRSLIAAAEQNGLPLERIVVEVNENDVIGGAARFLSLIDESLHMGLKLAIDDFGAQHAALNLLPELLPDQVKLDMRLVRDIDTRAANQAVVRAILHASRDLGIDVVAEGVESVAEYEWFAQEGVRLFQGFLFARPAFERFPIESYPHGA
jgi:EAL domain-containing protein (putative c-di-GMP-specific phosphodiesterase class I)